MWRRRRRTEPIFGLLQSNLRIRLLDEGICMGYGIYVEVTRLAQDRELEDSIKLAGMLTSWRGGNVKSCMWLWNSVRTYSIKTPLHGWLNVLRNLYFQQLSRCGSVRSETIEIPYRDAVADCSLSPFVSIEMQVVFIIT